MYNTVTEQVIRQTPQVGDVDTERLPQALTRIYAQIVTIRRQIADSSPIHTKGIKRSVKLLRRLANNLETLTVLRKDHTAQRSAAFVAGTAHYLLMLIRSQAGAFFEGNFSEHSIPPAISAIILFLIGNSPADAAEVAGKIDSVTTGNITEQIEHSLCLLAKGDLAKILELKMPDVPSNQSAELEALEYLWTQLFQGIQTMASALLGRTEANAQNNFRAVIDLSTFENGQLQPGLLSFYAGPLHLAKLLDILNTDLLSRGIINVTPPSDVDSEEWRNFLSKLALNRPYLWENHFDAVHTGFLNNGISAVLTFPTGAGKTTVSELKIASSLMSGRSVVYLVPTHALEDQVKRDLSRLFSQLTNPVAFDIDAEFTEIEGGQLPVITVMTPERCLTRLSIDTSAFSEVGLVVFDEFHLVSGRDNRLERRSMDAMFCLLRLFTEIPEADYLLISAMVENAQEICAWVEAVTGRPCKKFDSNWKPTRQLHGCVIFPKPEITALNADIAAARRHRGGRVTPPTPLKEQMQATAYQIFSLRNIWEPENTADYFIKKLLGNQVTLAISPQWRLTSNRNVVAADLAVYFAKQRIKTLVFVENPIVAVSTARTIHTQLSDQQPDATAFLAKHERDLIYLKNELGSTEYSYFNVAQLAAVHHGLMLPVERHLSEAYFRHPNGIFAVTATATLAQGINLPAEIVIIAGYDRFDEDTGYRETMQAHEILNAAGRAGRAGSAAQGVVIIVPGKIMVFEQKIVDSSNWDELRDDIFSKGDQCLTVNDPLNRFLDRISQDDELNADENNLLFRLNSDRDSEAAAERIFNNSLTAYRAHQSEGDSFAARVKLLVERKESLLIDLMYAKWVEIVSLKTGSEPATIQALGDSLDELGYDSLFAFSVYDWINWLVEWMDKDIERISGFFPTPGAQAQLKKALGLHQEKSDLQDIASGFSAIAELLQLYVSGENYETINKAIPGRNDAYVSKARNFVLRLVPHFSFVFGVVSMTLREKCKVDQIDEATFPYIVKVLATMIREGLDDEAQIHYKMQHPWVSRVECHQSVG
ncbi:MAG: DEAD/DEAH box helicase [Mucilaginibacter sp.]